MPLFGKSDPDLWGWNLTQFVQAEPDEFDLWLGSRVVSGKEEGERWSEIRPAEAARWLPVFENAHEPIRKVMDAAANGGTGTDDDFEEAAEATKRVTALIEKYALPPVIKMGSRGPFVSRIDSQHQGTIPHGETGEGAWLIGSLLAYLLQGIEDGVIRRCAECSNSYTAGRGDKRRRFCSKRCSARRRQRERLREMRQGEKIP